MSYRFASLSSGLLARKGTAQPAMASHAGGNPRIFHEEPAAEPAAVAPPPPPPSPAAVAAKGEALFRPNAQLARAGFSFESAPPPAPATPPRPEPLRSPLPPRATEQGGGCGQPAAACGLANPAAADPARRFHVSVRLKQSHFVRLKIASAQLRKPSQDIIGEALTAYFRTLDPRVFGDCACAAE